MQAECDQVDNDKFNLQHIYKEAQTKISRLTEENLYLTKKLNLEAIN